MMEGFCQGKSIFTQNLLLVKIHLPNFLTCLNLFCGCIATVMIFRNHFELTAYFVFAAAFFDLLDGMVARKVKSDAAFGKQLDSLADAVSFGFVPAAIMFKLLQMSDLQHAIPNENLRRMVQFFPFIIAIFSILRLAKFNLDTRQSTSFLGLPTPANTLLIISFPLILLQHPGEYDQLILNPYFILVMSMVSSFLLVSEIPLFSLKFKTASFKENKFQYVLIILAVLLVPILLYTAIPILILSYVFLSLIQKVTKA